MNMKTIYTKIMLAGMASLFLVATAGAQTDEVKYRDDINSVKMYKSVAKHPTNPDQYLITLESFVTGSKETHEVETHTPADIALVLDMSGSMGRSISESEYFPCPNEIEISYSNTKFPDHDQICSWSDGHPRYFALYSTNSNSELFYKDEAGNYHEISRNGASGTSVPSYAKPLMGDSYYYVYYETDEEFVDPFSGRTFKRRHFFGKDPDGTYRVRYFGDTTYPIVLKEGATPGSSNPADYEVMTGYYADNKTDYIYESDKFYTNSRLDALRAAIKSFLNVVEADDAKITGGEHHRVGVIKFASDATDQIGNDLYYVGSNNTPHNYTQIMNQLSAITTGKSDISSNIDELYACGNTDAGLGMQTAAKMMGIDLESGIGSSTDDRKKTIILFTDGEPMTSGSTFMESVANKAIDAANKLKAAGVNIYVVGLTDEATTKAVQFMEYCSSDYSDASSMSDGGSGKQFDKYFSLATTGEQLIHIFDAIASSEAKTEIGYDLSETGQVVLDALTDHFMLPEGVTVNNISVGTRDFTGINNDIYNFAGGDPVPLTGAKVTVGGEGNREIIVSGFDFSENWCGLWRSVSASGAITDVWQGKELVITIPIVVDPANPGGANNPTNEAYSGIYLADESDPTKPDMSKSVKKYPVPTLTMPNIVIKKNGLQGNDCAIFKIIKLDGSGNPETGYEPFTVMLTPSNNGKVTVKLVKEGRYKVVEDNWSWSYNIAPSKSYTIDDGKTVAQDNYIIRNVGEATADPTENGTIFNFSNTKRTDPSSVPAHGEDAVNNVFFTPKTVVH